MGYDPGANDCQTGDACCKVPPAGPDTWYDNDPGPSAETAGATIRPNMSTAIKRAVQPGTERFFIDGSPCIFRLKMPLPA